MADPEVVFSPEFLQRLKDLAIMNFVSRTLPEEEAAQINAIFRAFSKRGVPVETVLDAFSDLARGG